MKEAIITDLDGYMVDVTLVADHVTGVFSIKEPSQDTDESNDLYLTTGYIIASNVPVGLYKLKFDIDAYYATLEQYEVNRLNWLKKKKSASNKDQEKGLIEPEPPVLHSFWKEGYTPSELNDLLNKTYSLSNDGPFQAPIQIKKTNMITKFTNLFRKSKT